MGIKKTAIDGYQAELNFKSLAESGGFTVHRAPQVYDSKEHWDLQLSIKVDVKAMKKLNRHHTEPNPEWHWIEISSGYGDGKGWVYGSHADLVAFEMPETWILVQLKTLQEWLSTKIEKTWVTRPEDAKYRLYKRVEGEAITLVETEWLKTIGKEISKHVSK